jgi:hypothetical protein
VFVPVHPVGAGDHLGALIAVVVVGLAKTEPLPIDDVDRPVPALTAVVRLVVAQHQASRLPWAFEVVGDQKQGLPEHPAPDELGTGVERHVQVPFAGERVAEQLVALDAGGVDPTQRDDLGDRDAVEQVEGDPIGGAVDLDGIAPHVALHLAGPGGDVEDTILVIEDRLATTGPRTRLRVGRLQDHRFELHVGVHVLGWGKPLPERELALVHRRSSRGVTTHSGAAGWP